MLAFFLYFLLFIPLGERIRYWYSLDWREREIQLMLKRFPDKDYFNNEAYKARTHLVEFKKLRWRYNGDLRVEFDHYCGQVERWIEIYQEAYYLFTRDGTLDRQWCRVEALRWIIGEDNYKKGYVPPPYAPWLIKNTKIKGYGE